MHFSEEGSRLETRTVAHIKPQNLPKICKLLLTKPVITKTDEQLQFKRLKSTGMFYDKKLKNNNRSLILNKKIQYQKFKNFHGTPLLIFAPYQQVKRFANYQIHARERVHVHETLHLMRFSIF